MPKPTTCIIGAFIIKIASFDCVTYYSMCDRYGIRVNCILPGFITTPMTDAVPQDILQRVVKMVPLQRTGRPDGMYFNIAQASTMALLNKNRNILITVQGHS